MIYYICKYTPIELLKSFGEDTAVLDIMADNFDLSDQHSHVNLCGFGKSVLQAALSGKIRKLVLVNCCDVMRRVYDILKQNSCCDFLYMLDLPHTDGECQKKLYAKELMRLRDAYTVYSGLTQNRELFFKSFSKLDFNCSEYVALLGARVPNGLETVIQENFNLPVYNFTCVGNRKVYKPEADENTSDEELFLEYASILLNQIPCRRMADSSARRELFEDDKLKGIIYHTIKFCDYYGMEYSNIKNTCSIPITKIETDYTFQSQGQMQTRIEAFAETLHNSNNKEKNKHMSSGTYFVGIDSGSTSTDVVILDNEYKIVSSFILPTGGGAQHSAEIALNKAISKANLSRDQISNIVTTGYGRANIDAGNYSITEITCHARGAHYLYPAARTIIDIGGQDSKAIRIDESGKVLNFAMNDKCAAGTGRFLEMMAHTLNLSMYEMSKMGLNCNENIVISSMCTVFAESEVVSLVAQNKSLNDIVHGLNNSVAAKIAALIGRIGAEPEYIITGGVAQNTGVVSAIEKRLNVNLYVCREAQLCGAIGAALFASEK